MIKVTLVIASCYLGTTECRNFLELQWPTFFHGTLNPPFYLCPE